MNRYHLFPIAALALVACTPAEAPPPAPIEEPTEMPSDEVCIGQQGEVCQ